MVEARSARLEPAQPERPAGSEPPAQRAHPAEGARLEEREGRVLLRYGGRETPVRLAWARPVSGRGGEIACLDGAGKAVHLLAGPSALDEASRAVALRELERRYFLPRIVRVLWIKSVFGFRYWRVETDRGPRSFVIKDPRHSIMKVTEENWVLKDAFGSRYEIVSLEALDPDSRERIRQSF